MPPSTGSFTGSSWAWVRDDSSNVGSEVDGDWGENELSYAKLVRVLTTLSLSFGLVSVMSTLLAFYWFVKMKRSFRHEYE